MIKKLPIITIIFLAAILRFYKLDTVPPSLYWDEASLGYNAFSILKTAHDEHGNFLPFTNFSAFGDYKPPLYIYVTVPFIALLGLTEVAIRFPSALFGTLSVLLTFLLTYEMFQKRKIAFLSAFFLAISPWHVQMSRGAFEGNLGLFFSIAGILFFFKFINKNPIFIFLSATCFLAAMYTFTGQRLFVPIIVTILALYFWKNVLRNLKVVLPAAIISVLLFYPLFNFSSRTLEGKLRFEEVTFFKDLEPINESIKYRETDNFSFYSNVIHNRRLFFIREYLINYFDAFNPSLLFTKGDANPRLSIQTVGELYYFDLILVLCGLYFIFSKKYHYKNFLLLWLLVSPFGAATARETPHALRMIHILPTFQILSAIGLVNLYSHFKLRKLTIYLITLVLSICFFYYLHMYYFHWPKTYSGEWQYGYKQAVAIGQKYYDVVDQIVVTTKLGRPYIYFALYNQYDPKNFWQNAKVTRDNFYFLNVESFDKYVFSANPQSLNLSGKTLYIVSPGELPPLATKIETLKNLGNSSVFEIGLK